MTRSTVYDLVHRVPWYVVWKLISEHQPELCPFKGEFRRAWKRLLDQTPIPSDPPVALWLDETDTASLELLARIDGYSSSFLTDSLTWAEWLGCEIDSSATESVSDEVLAAMVLLGITAQGFHPHDVDIAHQQRQQPRTSLEWGSSKKV